MLSFGPVCAVNLGPSLVSSIAVQTTLFPEAQHVLAGAVRLKDAKKPAPEKVSFKCAKASLDATMMHLCQANSALAPGTMVRPLPKTKAKQPKQPKSARA